MGDYGLVLRVLTAGKIQLKKAFGLDLGNGYAAVKTVTYVKSGDEQRFNTTNATITMSGRALRVDNSGGTKDIIVMDDDVVPAGEVYGPDLLNYKTAFTSVSVTVPADYDNISDDKKFGVTPYD